MQVAAQLLAAVHVNNVSVLKNNFHDNLYSVFIHCHVVDTIVLAVQDSL